LRDEDINGGQSLQPLVGGELGREKRAKLDESILTGVEELPRQLHVTTGGLLIDGTVAVLSHQHDHRQRQFVLEKRFLESVRRLLRVARLSEISALLAQHLAAGHRLQLVVGHFLRDLNAGHFLNHFSQDE